MSSLNLYTGLFRSLAHLALRAHDPDVPVAAGVPANRPWPSPDAVGGAGWTAEAAERACVGEAIERWQTHPLASDRIVRAAAARWTLREPAIELARFVRFHRDQYARPGFPYVPASASEELDWVACRVLRDGDPIWVPVELAFLDPRPGTPLRLGPAISTGWAAHATPQAAVEAAVRELVERDALVGAWWGRYPVDELDGAVVRAALGDDAIARLARPNVRWRWYRIATPRAAHVALATLEGADREGHVFSIGSACRADLARALDKAALEAVQGRHYVRHLLATASDADPPTTFAEHATYYSRRPDRLADTCLHHAGRATAGDAAAEPFGALIERLPPIAFRLATPPGLVDRGYVVVRVIIPELQPLHGDHRLPFLGGPLWDRPVAAWADTPPHPFA